MRKVGWLTVVLVPAVVAWGAPTERALAGWPEGTGPGSAGSEATSWHELGRPAAGDDCSEPIKITLPADLIYTDVNTTCGRINDYEDTCLGYYDGGEDIIYELTVTEWLSVVFTLDPENTTWTALAVGVTCPPGDPCLAYSCSFEAAPHDTGYVDLEPGTYYVMVDTWPEPDCIPQFRLTIDEGYWPLGACCLSDGECIPDVWPSDCEYFEGQYQGDWTSCQPNPCPQPCVCGDMDGGGGVVDLIDFGVFALCHGLSEPGGSCEASEFACADLNADGLVDLGDFATFALLYGSTSTRLVPDCLDE